MQLDAELLPEERWPNRMPRGRVRPSPVAMANAEAPDFHATETRASILRKTHVRISRRHGQHDMREDRWGRPATGARVHYGDGVVQFSVACGLDLINALSIS